MDGQSAGQTSFPTEFSIRHLLENSFHLLIRTCNYCQYNYNIIIQIFVYNFLVPSMTSVAVKMCCSTKCTNSAVSASFLLISHDRISRSFSICCQKKVSNFFCSTAGEIVFAMAVVVS